VHHTSSPACRVAARDRATVGGGSAQLYDAGDREITVSTHNY